jgi:hypothetical protein
LKKKKKATLTTAYKPLHAQNDETKGNIEFITVSLMCSEEAATDPYTEPDKSSLHPNILFLKDPC